MTSEKPLLVRCPGCGYEGQTWEHDCPGRRREAVLRAALVVGRHWLDQEGVNAQYLDALGETVRLYDAPVDTRDRARQLVQACLDWHRGVIDRPTFLETVARLADAEECPVCKASLAYDEAKEHVAQCPGPRQRCDECDPSFGCFSMPARCCKRLAGERNER